jgi:hypothetical protein
MKGTACSTRRGFERGATGKVERRRKGEEEEGRGERREKEGEERVPADYCMKG